MTLGFNTLFGQRDVRETPAASATATAVGLTGEPYVLVSAGGADLTDERVLTAGEGIDLADGGAGTTITISGENATTSNKGIIELATEDEVQTGTDTTRAVVPDTLQSVVSPIGSIVAWLKSFTNTPQTLPTGWVECGGQTLSDADSVYNGQVIPNLNGNNQFPRGNSTSGGIGGAETQTSILSNQGTSGSLETNNSAISADSGGILRDALPGDTGRAVDTNINKTSNSFSILNKYYNVVWIMRVK